MGKMEESIAAAKDEKRWTPIRRGPVYCSPGCGFKCTWAAHQEAHRKGALLAKRLNEKMGPGWKYEVWENWTWHYKAVFNPRPNVVGSDYVDTLYVYVDRNSATDVSFTAFVNSGAWTATNPFEAVRLARESVKAEHARLSLLLAEGMPEERD